MNNMLLAVGAVGAAFGIGYWLGREVGRDTEPATAAGRFQMNSSRGFRSRYSPAPGVYY